MKRRLVNLLTALARLLLVAVAALWIRSYFVGEEVGWPRRVPGSGEFRVIYVHSGAGGLSVSFLSAAPTDAAQTATMKAAVEREPLYRRVDPWPRYPWVRTPARLRSLGFQTTLDPQAQASSIRPVRRFVIPYWFPAVMAAGLPVIRPAVAASRERRRRRIGLCPSCGYDLRATPGRCPECGATGVTLREP
jgi:hypothetical protein